MRGARGDRRTRRDHAGPTVFVGDADAWAANWALAARIREEAVIVVHGGPREYRALEQGSRAPPLLDDAERPVLGELRATLPRFDVAGHPS